MKRLLTELGFSRTEILVYLLLLKKEHTLKDIEGSIHMRQPEVSVAVSRLERRGLVVKRLLPLPEVSGVLRQGRPEKVVSVHTHGLMALIARAEHLAGDYIRDVNQLKRYIPQNAAASKKE